MRGLDLHPNGNLSGRLECALMCRGTDFLLPLIDPDRETVAESVDILSKVLHQAQIIGSHLDVDISILVLSASIDLFHLHFFLSLLWKLFSKRK